MKWDVLRYGTNIPLVMKRKAAKKRVRKGLLLFGRISIKLYIQNTIFRSTHILIILKPQYLDRLSNLWGNGFDNVYFDYHYHFFSSLMKLETILHAFLTSSGYPFKCVPISQYSLTFPSPSSSCCWRLLCSSFLFRLLHLPFLTYRNRRYYMNSI